MRDIHPVSSFHVIEDYLTKEECEYFLKRILDNSEADPKPGFRWTSIPVEGLGESVKIDWDADSKILDYARLAEKYFKDNYEISGELKFNRVHGNIMDEGAEFYIHTDEDPNDEGGYDGAKRTYVCGLFLNDDYEGGDFIFEDQDTSFVPKAGSLVFFPGWCTRHGIKKITKGSRVNLLSIFHDILPQY
jgi:hypothetical protein